MPLTYIWGRDFYFFALFWPGEVEGFFAVVGIDMAVKEGAVSPTAEFVARWCMMEACNDIPELSNAIGSGLDQTRIAPDLIEPAFYHRIITAYHKCVV